MLFRSQIGLWVDQDTNGGDALLDLGLENALIERGLVDLALFATDGDFNSSLGARAALGRRTENGTWRVQYEYAQNHLYDFGDDNDDLPQHRLRATRDLYGAGWSFSGYVEVGLWDSEHSLAAGLYLQRSF